MYILKKMYFYWNSPRNSQHLTNKNCTTNQPVDLF